VHVVDELVSRLAKAGVERIYGIVGDSQNPVTDAVRQKRQAAMDPRPSPRFKRGSF